MTRADVQHVAVLGAGSMGHGIAEVTAMAGYDVTMRDVEAAIVDEGYDNIEWSLGKLAEKGRLDESPADVLARIDVTTDVAEAVEDADLVVEAAPENLELKKGIFAEVDDLAPEDAILASNTSSLPITEMAAATERPEQVVGMHFFNPPVKMDLVEVIYGEETTDETAEAAYEFVESIDKTPIYVRKDVRGFVVNTVLGPFGDEAAWMVSEGEATVRQADAAMVHERGYPMGPFELADMTGIDVGYHVRKEAGDPIPPVIQEKVDADELGRKTGKGFYEYEGDDGGDGEGEGEDGEGEGDEAEGANYEPGDGEGFDTLRVEARMANRAAFLVGEGVATPEEIDTGCRLGLGFPEGICRRADRIGLDAILDELETLHEETGAERYEPDPYLVDLVEDGKTGEEAGQGFFDYGGGGAGGAGEGGAGSTRDYHTIEQELHDDGLLAITLDRPERLNALNQALLEEVEHLLTTVDTDAVRCVTFEGAGDRAFSAGADVTEFSGIEPHELDVSSAHETVASFPRPTIAKIDGYCLGGGHELALACDLRVATTDSEFGFPEINLGLLPGGGGTQRAIRMLGDARAKELVFRGEHISAERAEEWGLINRAVPPEEFEDVCEAFVSDIVNGPPIALEKAKQVMNDGADESLEAGLRMESQAFALLLTTDDVMEGAAAFMEDREPDFEGK